MNIHQCEIAHWNNAPQKIKANGVLCNLFAIFWLKSDDFPIPHDRLCDNTSTIHVVISASLPCSSQKQAGGTGWECASFWQRRKEDSTRKMRLAVK